VRNVATFSSGPWLERLEDVLLLGRLDVEEARDRVRERRRRVDRLHAVRELGRRLWQQRDRLDGLLLQVQRACLDFGVHQAGVAQELDARNEEREARDLVEHAEAPLALCDEMVRAVGCRQVTDHGRDRTDAVQVVEAWVLGLRALLQQEADLGLRAHRFLRARDGLLALHRDRQHDARERDDVADRQDDQHVLGQTGSRGAIRRGCRHGDLFVVAHRVSLSPQRRFNSSRRQPFTCS
jgi:hypothetical protein